MNPVCSNCAAPLESPWKFCPQCGNSSAHQPAAAAHPRHDHERAPVKGAFSGLLFGLLLAPPLIISGTMMCLMVGPWMAIGIPFIIAGICAPFAGPILGIGALRGICPWCGAKISSVGPLDAFYCYACSKPIVVREHEMVRAE